jgi:DNA-binding MarR family transcriptional regulator
MLCRNVEGVGGARGELTREIVQLHHAIGRAAALPTGEWLQAGVTMAQVRALFALARDEDVSVGHLARALGVGVSAASLLVERLVQQGLVSRCEDPSDRRRMRCRLSPGGVRLVRRLRDGADDWLLAALDRLDTETLADLARGLRGLAGACGASASDPEAGPPEADDAGPAPGRLPVAVAAGE